MSDLSNQLGLWCQDTTSVVGHLNDIQVLGFDYLVVRIVYHPHGASGATVAYEPSTLKKLIANAATMDQPLPIYAWAYVYPTNIAGQISGIAAAMPANCENLILDAEVEWESLAGGAALAGQLAHGIAEAIDHRADLHLSSFCNPSDHPLPYTAFLAHCQSFMPQAYKIGATSAQTVLGRTLAQAVPVGQQSLGNLIIPTVNVPSMLDLVNRHPDTFSGSNVWLYDGSGGDVGVSGNEDQWTNVIAAFKVAYAPPVEDGGDGGDVADAGASEAVAKNA